MAVPNFAHIVVVVMENHDYGEIIGSSSAPYINSLAASGALLTNYSDTGSHPSEPNYFGLYAGSTFGVTDDNFHSEPDPTLTTILQGAGKTFTGYVEGGNSDQNHNPWEYFPEGTSVEKDFSTFPSSSNYASLPTVSFVIPNLTDDMHDGTIAQGDTWLKNHLDAYAQWAKANNSLLAVVWDEGSSGDHVPAILVGADITPGTTNATAYNHYSLLSTVLAASGLTGPNQAATATPINVFSGGGGAGTLAGRVTLSSATEGTALAAGTAVARFTDSNTSDAASGFSATINWGDGSSSAGVVSGANGSFSVAGGHTYTDEGSFVLSTAITRTADNARITPTGTVAAAEGDALTPHAATITGSANQALSNVTVATFTDSNAANVAGDFSATIDWGDGTQGVGTISGSNGTFSVSGTHTYTAAGTDPVAVTLTDDTPGTATATANSTAQIGGGAGTLAGRVTLSSATEGTALAAGTAIASFTDSNTSDAASGFSAVINWGDGSSSAGVVSGANGSFTVAGGHAYSDEGSFVLSTAITRTADNAKITPTGTVTAAEGDVLTPHAATITGTANQALSNVTVATFTDSNAANVAGDFSATIDWGDGTQGVGTISGSNGTFSVSGTHTYTAAGTDPVAVTLTDDAPGTATATANSTAQIGGGAGTLAGRVTLSSATEGTALAAGTAIASFTDSNTSDAASGFSAVINWGDGSSSAGVVSGANGSFTVAGGHAYSDEGSFVLSTAITRTADNAKITPTGTVTAAEGDVLTPHAATITGTANQALSNVTVATFTDSNAANVAGDFSATIDWGDGTTAAGTVSGSNGTFLVSGTHTYTAAGTDPVAVTLSDDAPGTAAATANSTAQIGGGGGIGRTISSSIIGPITLAAADNPLTITSSGVVAATGSGADGIDGPARAASTITNAGTVTSNGGVGISLADGGTVANAAGGSIRGNTNGVYGAYGAVSAVTNAGIIDATGSNGAGVYLAGGGNITNAASGSISGAYIGVTILGGSGRVTNAGSVSHGVYLAGGGSLTNSAGASTSGNNFGVFIGVGAGTVTNNGSISSTNNNGVYLQAGGSVTNSNGASISGPGFGVAVYGGSGTVTNGGTISGGSNAVLFANSGTDRLVVDPTAVFNGSVMGGSGANTLELAGGTGSISGLSGGSGTVTENGGWSFANFGTVAVDAGGTWSLNGGEVANLSNNGTVDVTGSLHVSSAIDPASTGTFLLTDTAKLDVAAVLGTNTRMQFLGSSELLIDDPLSFGRNVGTASYAGPQLQSFGSGDTVDLKQFGSTGATLQFDSPTGILQVTNSASQHASLSFQTSSLGSGMFHAASDGGSGILITLS